jgi:hypothetical protein
VWNPYELGLAILLLSLFQHVNLNIYEWLYLVIKMEIIKNRSMT